jgi:hypothetical protein
MPLKDELAEYQQETKIVYADFGGKNPPGPPLPPAGGGGTFDGMEARVAKLEAHVEHILEDVSGLRTDMRDVRDRLPRIETRLEQLPTKGFVVTAAVATIALLGAIITMQQQIQTWLGIVHH